MITVNKYFDQATNTHYYATDKFVLVMCPHYSRIGFVWGMEPVIDVGLENEVGLVLYSNGGFYPCISNDIDAIDKFANDTITHFYNMDDYSMGEALGFTINSYKEDTRRPIIVTTKEYVVIIDNIVDNFMNNNTTIPISYYYINTNRDLYPYYTRLPFYFTDGPAWQSYSLYTKDDCLNLETEDNEEDDLK